MVTTQQRSTPERVPRERQPCSALPAEGRRRVVIEGVAPEVDCGRFPIKRVVGEWVVVEADVFADGHDAVAAVLRYRKSGASEWSEAPLEPLVNDRWRGSFRVTEQGEYEYTLQAWVDHFQTWQRDLRKRVDAGQAVAVELLVGADLVAAASQRATGLDAAQLEAWAAALRVGGSPAHPSRPRAAVQAGEAARPDPPDPADAALELALSPELAAVMARHPDRSLATTYDRTLRVVVDRERARHGAWYEFFPRSTAPEAGRHGTFRDAERMLEYVASMGFDVVYLPPIHPIGRTHRKGKNNQPEAGPGDPGSPWGIGAAEGGHTAVHPELGTIDDFRHFVRRARDLGLEVALDLAFQTSPDHPYVREHPEWFRRRPDGTIQYAENPPKKYQDIYPLNFETEAWPALWEELRQVVLYWVGQGVRIFRVDNPHTKPFRFWEWLIAAVKRDHPDVLFLSEAFTRPKVMYRLAKLGFTQSYTYFAWRNTKPELTAYFTELTQTPVREFFRPNLWPNTPDILTEYLQFGGRPAFMARFILAATLGASYGIYGPAFELLERQPLRPGSEEYLHSEKYELKRWDLERPDSLRPLIARVNAIRRANPALQRDWTLRFHETDNPEIICYSKSTEELDNVVLMVVNLDPYHVQAGWTDLALDALGLDPDRPFQVHDLLTDQQFLWYGPRNYVELNPQAVPAHILLVRRRTRTERDYEYFA